MIRKLTAEARAKMSAAAKAQMADPAARTRLSAANRGENNPMFGRHHTPEAKARIGSHVHSTEAREKMAAANRGRPLSDATKAKLSAALTGQKRSDEQRARMSAAIKAAWAKRRAAKATTEGGVK